MKKIFGKGGVIDNETRRWDKQADQITRDGDKSLASLFGMPGDVKPSHVLNQDSANHKPAVKFFQGKETADQSTGDTVIADNSSALSTVETTAVVAQVPEVQAPTYSGTSATDPVESVANSAVEAETKGEKSQDDKELKTSSSEITPEPQDDKFETSPIGATVLEVSGKIASLEEANTITKIDDGKILVWAKTLLEHKELTSTDKQGLPFFIKTAEAVESLTSKIFELASAEQDSSYVTIAIELAAGINDLYAGDS